MQVNVEILIRGRRTMMFFNVPSVFIFRTPQFLWIVLVGKAWPVENTEKAQNRLIDHTLQV